MTHFVVDRSFWSDVLLLLFDDDDDDELHAKAITSFTPSHLTLALACVQNMRKRLNTIYASRQRFAYEESERESMCDGVRKCLFTSCLK